MDTQNSKTDKTGLIPERKALQSSVFKAGKRTYFFDVFSASNGKKYLKITES